MSKDDPPKRLTTTTRGAPGVAHMSDYPSATRDILQAAIPAAAFGFDIGLRSTKTSFSISRQVIAAIADVLGPGLGAPLHAANAIIQGAELLTVASLEGSCAATAASLSGADAAFELAGVAPGGLSGVSPQLHALAMIAKMITEFTGPLAGLTALEVAAALTRVAELQRQERLRVRAEEGFPVPYLPTDVVVARAELDALPGLMAVAMAAYGDLACQALGAVPAGADALQALAPGMQLVALRTQSELYHPGHLVLVDAAGQRLLLVLRGTFRPQDVLTDLMCMHDPLENLWGQGCVHGGMFRAARAVLAAARPVLLAALDRNPDLQLVVAGHSLGAGVATLLTVLLAHDADARLAAARCVAFAPPCTVSSEFASHEQALARITSVVNEDDMVCRFGLATTQDLRAFVLRVHREPGVDLCTLRKDHASSVKLFPAGRVLHLTEGRLAGRVVVRRRDAGFFGELVLSESMFPAHMPHTYLERVRMC